MKNKRENLEKYDLYPDESYEHFKIARINNNKALEKINAQRFANKLFRSLEFSNPYSEECFFY